MLQAPAGGSSECSTPSYATHDRRIHSVDILIIGSEPDDQACVPAFREACEQIGSGLARAGHRLLLGSDQERYTDKHVAKGFCKDAHNGELIVLRHYGELSYEEIANLKGMPLGTVKNKLFRGRQMLKERLHDFMTD